MRKKAERQLPLDFAGTQKLTQDWYALYRDIHGILDKNPVVTDLVHADVTHGQAKLKCNVEGVASESILRLAIVQQIEQLSFRETIVRVDDSQMLRFFCRFYDDPVLSHSKYATLVNMIQPATWEKINEIIVKFARDKKGFKGKKLRIDTTAVESDIHYPTDSSLLLDCIEVLSRGIGRAKKIDETLTGKWRARLKNARKLAQKIARGGKRLHKATRKCWYAKLIAAAERALAKAHEVKARIDAGKGRFSSAEEWWALQELSLAIAHYSPLVEKCVHQARERVLKDVAVPNEKKIFSIFEPHTELLIRGKAGKEIEFGHMVEIQQIEKGLITGYKVHDKRPSEPPLVEQAVKRHFEIFGSKPDCVAGDKGFYSKDVLDRIEQSGVEHVCIPKKGKRNAAEDEKEKSTWFKAAQAFRAGIEGTVSVLKRAFGLSRCLREGFEHFASWVATGVLAHNLVLLARK
jgi:IS5 family transposase